MASKHYPTIIHIFVAYDSAGKKIACDSFDAAQNLKASTNCKVYQAKAIKYRKAVFELASGIPIKVIDSDEMLRQNTLASLSYEQKRVLGLLNTSAVSSQLSKSKGIKLPAKYRNVDGRTWAGRGLMPLWLRDAARDGRMKDFAV